MDILYFTRHVVLWHATWQSPIGSYPILGGNLLTRCMHILIGRATFTDLWSDGPPECNIWKKSYELGGNMLTRGMLTRGRFFWSDGPRLPSRNLPRRNDKLWKSTFLTSDLKFLCFRVTRMESRFFVSRKCYFLLLRLHAAGMLGLRFRAPNDVTSRAPTTPGEIPTEVGLPRGTCHKCQLLIGRHHFEASSACHVAKIDMWCHLIDPCGIICHVSSAHRYVPVLMSVGVDTWQPRGRLWWDGPRSCSFWSDGRRDFQTKTQKKC
jgi:hypothetical protein